jgi:hypothetical protein
VLRFFSCIEKKERKLTDIKVDEDATSGTGESLHSDRGEAGAEVTAVHLPQLILCNRYWHWR